MQKLTIIILSLILLSCSGKGESELKKEVKEKSDCLENLPEDFFILDTLTTIAGSTIYWQFNQDSSWLTYEELNGTKTILNSLNCSLMSYTYQLGTQRFGVYPKYCVFYHEWISGCCTPPDVIFLDNKVPKELKRIDSQCMIRLDEDFCMYFDDTLLNTASFLDLKTDKRTIINLPKDLLRSRMEPSRNQYPREFINDIEVNKSNLKIVYQYKNKQSDSVWIKDSIIVKMKK